MNGGERRVLSGFSLGDDDMGWCGVEVVIRESNDL